MGVPRITKITATSENSLAVKNQVDRQLGVALSKHASDVLKYIFFVVIGMVIAAIWDLNGKISQSIGYLEASVVSTGNEMDRLRREIKSLEGEIFLKNCLLNDKVIEKSGCYHVN